MEGVWIKEIIVIIVNTQSMFRVQKRDSRNHILLEKERLTSAPLGQQIYLDFPATDSQRILPIPSPCHSAQHVQLPIYYVCSPQTEGTWRGGKFLSTFECPEFSSVVSIWQVLAKFTYINIHRPMRDTIGNGFLPFCHAKSDSDKP